MLKKFAALFLLVLMSINSFAAVVGDNDGSAFITKAEFDSLKNTFQAQIDRYNASIDNKIDGAVSAYLDGVKVAKKRLLDSLLNELNQSWVSSATLDFPSTRIGSYKKYFINLGICKLKVDIANSLAQVQYLTGASNAPAWKTDNSTSYGIYYLGDKTDDGNYNVTKYIYSYPFASVAGIQTSGSWNASNSSFSVPSVTFTNSSADAFGASSDTWDLTCGASHNISVVKAFGVSDTYYTPRLDCLTGYQLDNSTQYFVENQYINKPGTYNYGDVQVDFCGYEIQSKGIGWTTSTNRNTKLKTYTHYYSSMNRLNVVNDKISKKMDTDIFYWEGCPVFKVGDKPGQVKIKLHIDNPGNKPTVFVLKEGKFTNTTISDPGTASTTYNVGEVIRVNADTDVEMEFEVKKDEVYWIKARPIYTPSSGQTDFTYPSKITTKSIMLTEE